MAGDRCTASPGGRGLAVQGTANRELAATSTKTTAGRVVSPACGRGAQVAKWGFCSEGVPVLGTETLHLRGEVRRLGRRWSAPGSVASSQGGLG